MIKKIAHLINVKPAAALFLAFVSASSHGLSMEGIYHCGNIDIGLSFHTSKFSKDTTTFDALYHFYPVNGSQAQEGCFTSNGRLDGSTLIADPAKWVVQPAGYGMAKISIDASTIQDGYVTAQIQHPSCNTPFKLTHMKAIEKMPLACGEVYAKLNPNSQAGNLMIATMDTDQSTDHSKASVVVAPYVINNFANHVGWDGKKIAPEEQEVTTMDPAYFTRYGISPPKYEKQIWKPSCINGQAEFQSYLMGIVNGRMIVDDRSSYYAIATTMGYFSDDPVEIAEIAEKVRPIVDSQLSHYKKLFSKEHYFIIPISGTNMQFANHSQRYTVQVGVGDSSSSSPMPQFISYDWNTDLLRFAISQKPYDIKVSPKEWKSKFQKYFKNGNFDFNWEAHSYRVLAKSRQYMDAGRLKYEYIPLIADIFDTKTGKSIVRWAVNGATLDEFGKLMPEVPFMNYAPVDGCKYLNKKNFKVTK